MTMASRKRLRIVDDDDTDPDTSDDTYEPEPGCSGEPSQLTATSLKKEYPAKYSSPIYDLYFKKKTDAPGLFRCLTCTAEVKKGAGGQSNLKKHYERKHPDIYKKLNVPQSLGSKRTLDGFVTNLGQTSNANMQDKAEITIPSPVDTTSGANFYYKTDSKRYKECKQALAEMISTDLQPVSVVNDPGFLSYSYMLDPKFVVPFRDTVQNELKAINEKTKMKVVGQISCDIDWYCIIFDVWTSRAQNAFISLTLHFINKHSWILESLNLGAYPFQGTHGAKEIAEQIKSLLEEWELPSDKLAAITCDNASNNIKCIKENFSVPRVRCVGHVLNLAVSDALKVRGVSEIISRSRSLVEHFHRSRISSEKLEAKAKEDHQQPLKLIQDVPTRWNSTYLMMVRLLHLKEYLIKIVEESLSHQNAPSPAYMLNVSEWNVLEQLIPLLQPFYDVTTWISGSSYVTVSAAGPSLAMLKLKLRTTNDTPIIKRFKEAAMAKLDKYFHDTEEETLLDVCSYLDPRFRAFQHRVEERSSVQEMVCDKLMDIMTESVGQPSGETYDTIGENRNRLSGGSVGTSSGWARLLGSVLCSDDVNEESRDAQNESVRQRALKEVGRYVLPVASIDTSPLEWWKIYSTSLPYLSQLAKRYLCIVATSVPSECLFSIAGQIVSARRSGMLPEHTNMLCFLHSNLSCRKPHLPQYQRLWDACGCPKCQALASEKGAGKD